MATPITEPVAEPSTTQFSDARLRWCGESAFASLTERTSNPGTALRRTKGHLKSAQSKPGDLTSTPQTPSHAVNNASNANHANHANHD